MLCTNKSLIINHIFLLFTVEQGKIKSRLLKFKKFIPRKEIEVIWSIMAYFSKGVKMVEVEKNDVYRWKLISLLFKSMTGVLSKGCR